jgi:hypothetical protein
MALAGLTELFNPIDCQRKLGEFQKYKVLVLHAVIILKPK